MKILYAIPVLLMLAGASCEHRSEQLPPPNYPPNTLTLCPEIQQLVYDEKLNGIQLGEFYKEKLDLNKQYADCATIHNALVKFIKQQQEEK